MVVEKEIEEQNPGKYYIDDALNLIVFGRAHYRIIILCGFITFMVNTNLIGLMMVIPAAECDLELSTSDKGLLISISWIGVMVPAYMWGYLSDTRGRRKIMLISLICLNFIGIASSFAPTFIIMLVFRFLSGFFISGVAAGFYPYLSEFTATTKRSPALAWATSLGSIGYVYAPILMWLILLLDFHWMVWDGFVFRPWRLLFIAFVIPGFIALYLLYQLPESPKFLLSQGRKNQAIRTIHWLYVYNTGDSSYNFAVRELLPEPESAIFEFPKEIGCFGIVKTIMKQTMPLFKPPYLCHFLIIIFIQISLFSVGSGMTLWFTELQNRISKSNHTGAVCEILNNVVASNNSMTFKTVGRCDDTISTSAYINSLIFGTCCIVGLLIISLSMKHIGRAWIMLIWLIGSACCGVALQFVTEPNFIIALFCLFLTFAQTAISVAHGTSVILFPTNVRSMAHSIAATFGRLSSAATSTIIGLTIESYCNYTFAGITGLLIVASFLTMLLPFKKLNQ